MKQDRRDFLKTATLLGGSAFVAVQVPLVFTRLAQGAAQTEGRFEEHDYTYNNLENMIASTCLQCHVACPIRVKLQQGVVVKIDGNPYSPQNLLPHFPYATPLEVSAKTDGKLCPAGHTGIQTLYDPYRLTRVLKRAGPRGSNQWRSIPFDQAVAEIVEGGDLFGEGPVEGLRQILALTDPQVAKALAADVEKIKQNKMSVAEFKARHAAHLNVLIDPDHPDKGPKNNQFTGLIGRAEHGRKEFLKRLIFDTFGSPNYIDHFNICEESHHITTGLMTDQYSKGKWGGGKHHLKPDLLNAEFVIFFGTGAYEANFGKTPMAEKVTKSLRERNFKMAVVDPRLSKTAGKANWWLPVKPGGDAALAMGMMRWIFENERYDQTYLENANKAAASQDGEPTWSSASYLVKLEGVRPAKFLRASEVGIGTEHQFVVSRGGKLIAVTPTDKANPIHGDLFAEASAPGIVAKTSLLLLRERAYEKSLAQYAELSGIELGLIVTVAREFTSHGKKAAIDAYRGACQHTDGYYMTQAINCLNFLIGNLDWKGGLSAGGGHWHEFGGKPGNVYNFKKLYNAKLTKFGMTQSREGWRYEDTTLFREQGYPAKRPFYPFSSGMYTEVLPSALDGYPYPMKCVYLHKGTPALSIPAAQAVIQALKDPRVVPLVVACDIVIGETSMYADYIIPDLTYLERWGTPHVTPDVQTKTSKVRQPAAAPLTEMVTVDGEQMPISSEAFLLAVAKRLGLPGVGKNGFGPGMDFHRPEDFYLRAMANLAAGDKEGEAVPDASAAEMDIFVKARRHLPPAVFDLNKWRRALRPEEWAKVVYVLNRGGRYEDFSKAYKGNYLGHQFGKMVSFFVETVAQTKSSITGQYFDGLPRVDPVKDAGGNIITDEGYPFQLITYKEVYWGHSRQASSYWTLAVLSENHVLMNTLDAQALGLKDGDVVRLSSKTNPQGILDLGDGTQLKVEGKVKVLEGIRPGTVAVSWHFGHWNAYGASDKIEIDGGKITPDPRRAAGLVPNPVIRLDESVGKASLTDPIGGSCSWYDTRVRVAKVS